MRTILVTGAATWAGGRLIEQLTRDANNRVFAVDDVEPQVALDAEFEKLSIDRLDFARYLLDVGPEIVVHLQTVDRSTEIGGARAHEESVVGAQALHIGTDGRSVFGSPRHALVLSPTVGPDCDGDGLSDYYTIALGLVPDTNGNLVPDACDP